MNAFADRVWWHVYALGAVGAPIRDVDVAPQPRLQQLLPWIDQAAEWGFDGLILGPVFAATSHGYDTLDHFRVDPRLGTERDLLDVIERAHDSGMAVVLDGVFNHVGAQHEWVTATVDAGPTGTGLAAIDWVGDSPAPRTFEGHASLVALRHESPEVRREIARIMTYWLDRGVDGWRLDAAYAVPAEAWADIIGQVRVTHPAAWFLGEMIHGDYAGFVEATGVDTVTQYELWKAIWSSMLDHNPHELAWTLERHAQFCDSFTPLTFVGNHDVTRIATRVDAAGAAAAVTLLAALPGTPAIYYGDEHGALGTKEDRLGGDDEVRPALPAPHEANTWPTHADEILAAHLKALEFRARHPWIARGQLVVDEPQATRLTFTVTGPTQRLRATMECGESPRVDLSVEPA